MRPIYESANDRRRQDDAIRALALATASEAVATPRLAGWDYEMQRNGKCMALVEVKCRTCRSDTYPTYMLALHKAHRLRQASSDRNVRGVLLVAWTDRIGWLRLDGMDVKSWIVTIGGRTDRSDPADVEMVVEFPIHQFSTLVTKENRR